MVEDSEQSKTFTFLILIAHLMNDSVLMAFIILAISANFNNDDNFHPTQPLFAVELGIQDMLYSLEQSDSRRPFGKADYGPGRPLVIRPTEGINFLDQPLMEIRIPFLLLKH